MNTPCIIYAVTQFANAPLRLTGYFTGRYTWTSEARNENCANLRVEVVVGAAEVWLHLRDVRLVSYTGRERDITTADLPNYFDRLVDTHPEIGYEQVTKTPCMG